MEKIKIKEKKENIFVIILVWLIGILWFFPILYMVITSLKSEMNVVPPSLFIPHITFENYITVLSGDIISFGRNSLIVTITVTAICLIFGIPAAYAIVFGNMKKPDFWFFNFIGATLLPAVLVIIPIFLVFKNLHLLDTQPGLIILYSGANIPFIIWMVYSFFKEVPKEILEACDIDGGSKLYAFFNIIVPLTKTGIISAALLVIIFVWNEFFIAVNITYVDSATLPVHMASFMTQEGLFWAKLSAIATLTVLPPLILGWITQKAMIKGLTMGAVKG